VSRRIVGASVPEIFDTSFDYAARPTEHPPASGGNDDYINGPVDCSKIFRGYGIQRCTACIDLAFQRDPMAYCLEILWLIVTIANSQVPAVMAQECNTIKDARIGSSTKSSSPNTFTGHHVVYRRKPRHT
jgi:hypothetical protein